MIKRITVIAAVAALAAGLPLTAAAAAPLPAYHSGSSAGIAIQAGGNIAYRYAAATWTANGHLCNGGGAGTGLGAGTHPAGVGTQPQIGAGENWPAAYAYAGITCTGGVYTAGYEYKNTDGTASGGVLNIGPIATRDKIAVNVYAAPDGWVTATATDLTTDGATASTSWAADGTVFKSADVEAQYDAGSITTPPTSQVFLGSVTGVKVTQRNGAVVTGQASKVILSTDGSATGPVWVAPTLTASGFSLATSAG